MNVVAEEYPLLLQQSLAHDLTHARGHGINAGIDSKTRRNRSKLDGKTQAVSVCACIIGGRESPRIDHEPVAILDRAFFVER
ncbi:hypothetical protein WKW79_36905 [Variovorax robiniae]|uniref:Uncharacterized protein n=1 Tax=Variovorax robiniae TaxID=1836199 RepID=A0ABU8XKV2_9BURK